MHDTRWLGVMLQQTSSNKCEKEQKDCSHN